MVGFRVTVVEVVRALTMRLAAPLLVECTLSFGVYVAVMLRGLVPVSLGVTVAVHEDVFPAPAMSVQVVKVSFASWDESVMVPAGLDPVPAPVVSDTVTVIVL